MAFCCQRHLRYGLRVRGHRISAERIQDALHRMQISLMHDTRGGGLYGVPFMISAEKTSGGDVRCDVAA